MWGWELNSGPHEQRVLLTTESSLHLGVGFLMSRDISLGTSGKKGLIFAVSWGLTITEGIFLSPCDIAQGVNPTVETDSLKRFKSCSGLYGEFFFSVVGNKFLLDCLG